jgi:4-amino-4-deoxy-L-arabinose transferase-like glycosyltransferase
MDASAPARAGRCDRWTALAHFSLLALLASLAFFSRLDCPLLEPEEARYAEIPRQMLAEGRFVVPVLHGQPYYDKPPLLYWLVMGCFALFGPHDWAARLVPGAAGVLTVLLTYGWGRRALGPAPAMLGALVLCLAPRFLYQARMLSMDSLLSLWVTAGLLAAYGALRRPPLGRRWWLLSAGAAGLGLLTKGPVALALIVPPVLALRLLDRRACRPSLRAWLAYLGVALGVAGPWYLCLRLHDPQAVADFFWRHNVVRYVEPFDHARPVWFYVPGLVGGLLPWTLLAPFAWRWARRETETTGGSFFLLASLWAVAFFSASGCKRAIYLLPALPPLALALGSGLAAAPFFRSWGRDRLHWLVRPATLAGGIGLVIVAWLPGWLWLPDHHRASSLREQVRCATAGPGAPVACYPRRWDSISFYLARSDVRVYERGQLTELLTDLQARPETLIFAKSEGSLNELRQRLPPSLELEVCGPGDGPALAVRARRRAAGPCQATLGAPAVPGWCRLCPQL